MRARTISPSTRTSSPSSALAPVPTTSPLIVTRPARNHSSASRREHKPASLMYLFTRMRTPAQRLARWRRGPTGTDLQAENKRANERKLTGPSIFAFVHEREDQTADILSVLFNMARPERFELPTTKFVAWYSIQLSYGRIEPTIIPS